MSFRSEHSYTRTRNEIKQAAALLAEPISSPGEAGDARPVDGPGVVKSSVNIDDLIRAYLESGSHDAWCLPTPEEASKSFTRPEGLETTARNMLPQQRRDAGSRREGWQRVHEFSEPE
jgi:hypothetical protein